MNSPRKHRLLKDTVMGAALTVLATMAWGLGLGGSAFAQEPNRAHRGWSYHHRERGGRENFVMGVCVGQTLAQKGITLPMPEPGKPPALDSSQEEAMQSAVEACRASMSGVGTGRVVQSPTPAPTVAPTAAPTVEPTSAPPTAPMTSPTSLGSTAAPASSNETPAPAVTVTESPSASTS